MAREIFVPVLKKMGLKGVRFTGGDDEMGIDIEYYELTQPEKNKNYVGIQFKKNNLIYSSGGAKGSVKEVKNQAEEAFEKEIYDLDGKGVHYISRFVVATTGIINENARKYIGKARLKGNDRQIFYWPGDRLAEYIQKYYMNEFEEYFSDKIDEEGEDKFEEGVLVDEEYINDNYDALILKVNKIKKITSNYEWEMLKIIAILQASSQGRVPLVDLLMELGKTEDYLIDYLTHLVELELLYIDEDGILLDGYASDLLKLYEAISQELVDADEDVEQTDDIFKNVIK